MTTLSVIVITKNEAKNIRRCLESVDFAQEIIVIDSGSFDETCAIAKEYTPHIYHYDWAGFGPQKNIALSKTSCEWVLTLDADEAVSLELKQEIQSLLANEPNCDAYYIPLLSTFCNQVMRYGEWKNEQRLRLFKKNSGRFKEVPVHEKLMVTGKKGYLKNYVRHYSFPHLEEVLEKLNRYSTLSAEHKYTTGQRGSLFTAIIHGLWTFIRGYFLKCGFLDGKKGFMLAVSNAEGSYYRYLKIMLLEENS